MTTPNKNFDAHATSELVRLVKDDYPINPEELDERMLNARRNTRHAGVKPFKKHKNIPYANRGINRTLSTKCADPNFEQRLNAELNLLFTSI